MTQFKDACDLCNKMDYCKGYEGKVLCQECIAKEESNVSNDKSTDEREDVQTNP